MNIPNRNPPPATPPPRVPTKPPEPYMVGLTAVQVRSIIERMAISPTELEELGTIEAIVRKGRGEDRVLRCAFCGYAYPDGTPTHKHELLTAHIRECPDHPIGKELRAANERIARLERA